MGKARASGSKVSNAKLANKRKTKQAKQHKLPSQKQKDKERYKAKLQLKQQLKVPVQPTVNVAARKSEEDADPEYLETANIGFTQSNLGANVKVPREGNKRKHTEVDLEKTFEGTKRSKQWLHEYEGEPLLPIKDNKKIIMRSLIRPELEEPSEEEADASEPEPEKTLPELASEMSVVELMAARARAFETRKQLIASLSCSIVEDPQTNYGKLKPLRDLWEDRDLSIRTASRKLLMVSLTEIYKDILPDYNIRIATELEKSQPTKADIKKLRAFEESLLSNYKRYLQLLEQCIGESGNRKGSALKAKDAMFRRLACRCMCDVFVSRPTFNFMVNIIPILTSLLTTYDAQIRDCVCSAYRTIFREDKQCGTSLEVVRSVCKLIKGRHFNVNPKVLDIFLSLRIKEIRTDDTNKKEKRSRKERFLTTSRKERKRDKKRSELDKEMEEASLQLNNRQLLQTKTDIVSAIFTLYFIILKKDEYGSLLSAVLAGLAKFAHLINIDFFDDLFKVFNKIITHNELPIVDTLNIVQTSFTILSGQGEALNIDPQHFYTHLYCVLPELATVQDEQQVNLINRIPTFIELVFVHRKKKVTKTRVLAFTKRLCSLAVGIADETECLNVFSAIKTLCSLFKVTDILFDTDKIGNGVYRPDLDDPEYCNPQNSTVLYELHVLTRHPSSEVKQMAKQILKISPDHQGGNQSKCATCRWSIEMLLDAIARESRVDLMNPQGHAKKPKQTGNRNLLSLYK